MATWYGSARTNHFSVRDEATFLAWVEELPGVEAEPREREGERTFCLLEENGEGWPSSRPLEEPVVRRTPSGATYREYDEELDLPRELSEHLAAGEVAVIQEIGAEKLRYLTGYSLAVNSEGEVLRVDIDDIYPKIRAAGWGEDVSTAAM